MSQFTFKMPDLGEGTVDAEIVAWHTKPGDTVSEDQLIVEVMTDKAAVEVPAPVSGRVVSVTGAPGDKVAVGSPLIVFELSEGAKPAEARSRTGSRSSRHSRGIDAHAVGPASRQTRGGNAPGGRACGQRGGTRAGRAPRPRYDLAGQSTACERGGHRPQHRGGLGSRRANRASRFADARAAPSGCRTQRTRRKSKSSDCAV